MPAFKTKAQAPLVVDANAVSAFSNAFKRIKAVVGRNPQIIQPHRTVQHGQFAFGDGSNIGKSSNVQSWLNLPSPRKIKVAKFQRDKQGPLAEYSHCGVLLSRLNG